MISKEDADNLENESPKELVDIICSQSELIDSLEAQLKAKDEEIEKLKAEKECAKSVIDWHEKECEMYIKLHHQKARSIVAMLFWDIKKYERYSKADDVQDYVNNKNKVYALESIFKKAYAMVKDNKC